MRLKVMIDPEWRAAQGQRPYRYARACNGTGYIRPVRYAGLSQVIGTIQTLEGGLATITVREQKQAALAIKVNDNNVGGADTSLGWMYAAPPINKKEG